MMAEIANILGVSGAAVNPLEDCIVAGHQVLEDIIARLFHVYMKVRERVFKIMRTLER